MILKAAFAPPSRFLSTMRRVALGVVFAVYCFEAGLFFLIAPWTKFWALNPILHATDLTAAIAENGYVRGMVSGFGLIHLFVGTREVIDLIRNRRRRK